ncbi:MAG: radical SAM protein [Deltaproteobacteria bacterium]|nr:radical SAM protein [Deltaproteobacteria bacterium]
MSGDRSTRFKPRYCVYEVTLACDARCIHCGSTAGRARANELDLKDALHLFDDLADLGCESVTLSGGEPLERPDWPDLVAGVRERGMRAELITNGLQVAAQADRIAAAGFFAVTFSVDGPPEVHDRLRGVPGAFERVVAGAAALVDRGVRIGAATQINRQNLPLLDRIHDLLVEHRFEGWQVQLTMPHGRAAALVDELCLKPVDLLPLESALLAIKSRTDLFVQAADNIGYMGRSEPVLRAGRPGRAAVYGGCQAGMQVVGLTSDGAVRGCLSMPPSFDEGNIKQRPFTEIWNDPEAFAYNRGFATADLDQPCRDCAFAKFCRAGCHSMAVAATGSICSNPYCLHLVQRAGESS